MLLLLFSIQFSSVQSLSHVRLFATPWTTACQASLSITNSQSPPKPIKSCSTLWSYELQHGRPLCPSSSARPCPSPCPLNRWRSLFPCPFFISLFPLFLPSYFLLCYFLSLSSFLHVTSMYCMKWRNRDNTWISDCVRYQLNKSTFKDGVRVFLNF